MNIFMPFYKGTTNQCRLVALGWVVLGLLLWQYALPAGLSRPYGTWEKLVHQYENGLMVDFLVSLKTIGWACAYAFPTGCLLGYLYTAEAWKPPVRFIASMRNMGTTAVIAGLILIQFSGDMIKTLTIGLIILVYFLSSLTQQFDNIHQERLDLARTMNMTPTQTLWHLVVRGELYQVCANFIPNIGIGWSMLSIAEGVVRGSGGIGDLLLQQDKISSMNGIVALAGVTNITGHIIAVACWFVLRRLFRYASNTTVAA